MSVVKHAVDNRVFLIGLDDLYRDAMKRHERDELRHCGQSVVELLEVEKQMCPVEGYYSEDAELTEYFLLVCTLQGIGGNRRSSVANRPEFQRLLEVTSSPIFGEAVDNGKLLPVGRDPISKALAHEAPDWTLKGLTNAAQRIALATEDYSLVGLAARAADPVVITALRESVVLYAELVPMCAESLPREKYVWKVDRDLERMAARFVETFNALFDETLPIPKKANAETFWNAAQNSRIFGRCVRLGFDDSTAPHGNYHWAICRDGAGDLMVQDFWHTEVWTTERYSSEVPYSGLVPNL